MIDKTCNQLLLYASRTTILYQRILEQHLPSHRSEQKGVQQKNDVVRRCYTADKTHCSMCYFLVSSATAAPTPLKAASWSMPSSVITVLSTSKHTA